MTPQNLPRVERPDRQVQAKTVESSESEETKDLHIADLQVSDYVPMRRQGEPALRT